MMIPINISEQRINHLASTFGCSIGSLPFTYLGLPLSLSKPNVADFWPLVSKCERRLVTISSFLTYAGRLQMTNAVLSALPTYAMCTFLLPKTVIKQIDKFRKHYLWRGSDMSSKKPPKAAWKLVCNSHENGGLGIHDLQLQNECLLLKHLHKFFNQSDIPWVRLIWNSYYGDQALTVNTRLVSFWWRDILKLLDPYKNMAQVTIGNGVTASFWKDIWHGMALQNQWPHLFSFVRIEDISVQSFLEAPDKLDFFHLPLSIEAYDQYQTLLVMLQTIQPSQQKDNWHYTWGSLYSSSKAYKHLLGTIPTPAVYKWMWDSDCLPKRKFFSG